MMYTHLRHVSICRTREHLHRTLSLQAVRGRETRKLPRATRVGLLCHSPKKKNEGQHHNHFDCEILQPIPPAVTFFKALSKLKAQSSNVLFHKNVAEETFKL